MIVLGIVLILLSIFLAGWGIALWIGIGLIVLGAVLNMQPNDTGRRGRYW